LVSAWILGKGTEQERRISAVALVVGIVLGLINRYAPRVRRSRA
jgi:hypothetical protein